MNDTYSMREPETITELKQLCTYNRIPLEKIHFYIGSDHRMSYAFGIYEASSTFVVYKNESGGTRAVYYSGPDEQYAVGMLANQLWEECRMRGICAETKMWFRSRSAAPASMAASEPAEEAAEMIEEIGQPLYRTAPAGFTPACGNIADVYRYVEEIVSGPETPDFLAGGSQVQIDLFAGEVRCCPDSSVLRLLRERENDIYYLYEDGRLLYEGHSEEHAAAWMEKCLREREARLNAEPPKDFVPSFQSVKELRNFLKQKRVRYSYADKLFFIDDKYDGKPVGLNENGQTLIRRKNSDRYCVFRGRRLVYCGPDESAAVAWFEKSILKFHNVYRHSAFQPAGKAREGARLAYIDDYDGEKFKKAAGILYYLIGALCIYLIIRRFL